jgi:hypothetical protein
MRELLGDMKEITVLDSEVSLNSSMKEEDVDSLDAMADTIIESMK